MTFEGPLNGKIKLSYCFNEIKKQPFKENCSINKDVREKGKTMKGKYLLIHPCSFPISYLLYPIYYQLPTIAET